MIHLNEHRKQQIKISISTTGKREKGISIRGNIRGQWNGSLEISERGTRLVDIKIVCHKIMKYIKYKKSIFFSPPIDNSIHK